MNAGARWVVDAFLAELDHITLNDPTSLPLWRQDRLLRLARMVVVELSEGVSAASSVELLAKLDAESAAVVKLADVVDQFVYDPTNPLTVASFVTARQRYCDVLQAACDARQ